MIDMVQIAPSMLAADFLHLEKDVELVNEGAADWFHLDIMDGAFVPNITLGFDLVNAIKGITDIPLDVHMMVNMCTKGHLDTKVIYYVPFEGNMYTQVLRHTGQILYVQ